MPFREKSAWFVAIGLVLTFGVFYAAMLSGLIEDHGHQTFWAYIHSVGLFVVLQVILHIVAIVLAPKEAGARADEREQLILLKSARNAGLVLAVGVVAIPFGLHLPLRLELPAVIYLMMAVFIFSEFVRAVSKIVYYRRGR